MWRVFEFLCMGHCLFSLLVYRLALTHTRRWVLSLFVAITEWISQDLWFDFCCFGSLECLTERLICKWPQETHFFFFFISYAKRGTFRVRSSHRMESNGFNSSTFNDKPQKSIFSRSKRRAHTQSSTRISSISPNRALAGSAVVCWIFDCPKSTTSFDAHNQYLRNNSFNWRKKTAFTWAFTARLSFLSAIVYWIRSSGRGLPLKFQNRIEKWKKISFNGPTHLPAVHSADDNDDFAFCVARAEWNTMKVHRNCNLKCQRRTNRFKCLIWFGYPVVSTVFGI